MESTTPTARLRAPWVLLMKLRCQMACLFIVLTQQMSWLLTLLTQKMSCLLTQQISCLHTQHLPCYNGSSCRTMISKTKSTFWPRNFLGKILLLFYAFGHHLARHASPKNLRTNFRRGISIQIYTEAPLSP